ncbi:MAG: hypothetical protein FWF90_08060 [Promicromonosporaceae bacterium]|nr:hypothetical protein [Promicromonosporaceae bacterium]
MTLANDVAEAVAGRLTGWVRGGPGTVVTEGEAAIAWLGAAATGLVTDDTLVVVTGDRRARGDLPDGPGIWARATGSLAADGADVALGADFFLESVGYARLQEHGIVGPTAVRLFTPADAAALVAHAQDTLLTGRLPGGLLHRSVELGDQCAVAGEALCAGRGLHRLHVAADGTVRTSPAGRMLGASEDSPAVLRAAAGEGLDPCLGQGVHDVLATARPGVLATFVAALRLVRTLVRHRPGDWVLVTGEQSLLTPPSTPARADLCLVTDGETFLLSDPQCRRPIQVGRAAAQVVEAMLASASLDDAAALLAAGGTARTVEEVSVLAEALGARGVALAHAS